MAVRQRSKHELVAALQGRYRRADRAGKARLLDEFCAATGYHRKDGIRLLRNGPPPPRVGHGGEFLNSHLVQYCQQHRLTFTRSRPYWKNDQAHVELCGCPHNSTYADYGIMRTSAEVGAQLRGTRANEVGIIPALL